MSLERCQHPTRVKGTVQLEFTRPDASEGPYTRVQSRQVYVKSAGILGCMHCFSGNSVPG